MEKMITVGEVMRRMGVRVSREVSWQIGWAVRDMYLRQYGHLPLKELRPKGRKHPGSHCLAIYPESWRPRIEDVILQHKHGFDKQFRLF